LIGHETEKLDFSKGSKKLSENGILIQKERLRPTQPFPPQNIKEIP
tara:strand:+ start:445 stop:582 length:138 start_codon:yes stop_codon:yes gene_type:complete